MFKLTLFIPLFIATSAGAQAVFDQSGMPRCTRNAAGESLIFTWNRNDSYAREIQVLDTGTFTSDQEGARRRFACRRRVEEIPELPQQKLQNLPPGTRNFRSFDLSDPRMQKALTQVRNGGNSYREEATAAEYLKKNPMSKFDRGMNRMLTALYGVGFVSELYAEWLLQNPQNKMFADTVKANVSASTETLRPKIRERVFVYVKGLYRATKASKNFDAFANFLRGLGGTVIEFPTEPVSCEDNAAGIKNVLDTHLKAGKRVVIIGLSKGATDALLALSMLRPRLEGPAKPTGYGTVEAFISLSGIYEGSFSVDWMYANLREKLEARHKQAFTSEGLPTPSVAGLMALRSVNLRQTMGMIQHNGLPKETFYFNIVGTIGGDGLAAPNSAIRKFQDETSRVYMSDFGANDGYIEYPAGQIPAHLVKKIFVLPIQGTHPLADGKYLNMPMNDTAHTLVRALTISIFNVIEK